MKRIIMILLFTNTAILSSSCDGCYFFAFFLGSYLCEPNPFYSSVDQALYGSEPVVLSSASSEPPKRLPPDQIVGDPVSSQPGGGNDNAQEQTPTFMNILTSPVFTLGPSLSWLGGDKSDGEKFTARPGLQLGAIWKVPLTSGIAVEPGLLFSNRSGGT